MSKVKELFEEDKKALGTWVTIQHSDTAEILSTLPFDWLMFDLEHAPADISTLEQMLPAVKRTDITPFVRVPWNDMVRIKRALDLGFEGILVPYVNSAEEAEAVVKSCKYPPEGIRGVGPRRATMYGSIDAGDYFYNFEKEDLVISIQIESSTALKNLDEILSVEGIDMAFVGPMDLSANLEIFRQFDHPKFQNAIEKLLKGCEENDVTPGIFCGNAADAKEQIKKGFKFVSIGTDYLTIREAYSEALENLREL